MKSLISAAGLCLLLATPTDAQLTNTCYFVAGPRKGATQAFAGYPPIQLGTVCNDGAGSVGFASPNGIPNPSGAFSMSQGVPSCMDVVGAAVPYVLSEAIPKSGFATLTQAGPVIYIRGSHVAQFAPEVATFLYAHECGHHALGQVRAGFLGVPIGPDHELAADCFALRELARGQLLGGNTRAVIMTFLAGVPGDPSTYPGPFRVQRLSAC